MSRAAAHDRGFFVTLEGGEGAGKSTQVGLLAGALRAAGHEVVATREPGGAPGAEEIRQILVSGRVDRWSPLSELLLFVAARREHVDRTIEPALSRGAWVVCDRFSDSTVAYQGYGGGLIEECKALQQLALGAFQPDLTLVLDLAVELGLERARTRSGHGKRYEQMGLDFHRRVREGFLQIARLEPARCRVIDGRGTIEEVQTALRRAVAERFGVKL